VNMVWSLESLQTKRLSRRAKGVGLGRRGERRGLSEVVSVNVFNEYVTEFARVLTRRTQLKRRGWDGRLGIIGNYVRKQIKRRKE